MKYAPVLIPTLCRYTHLKRCIDSLSKCNNAIITPLIVFLDFPAKKDHESGYNEIKKYLQNVSGFKTITIVEREKNYGAVDNIHDGIIDTLKLYDRFILSEDDNEFSPNFLDYINSCLNKYIDNKDVIAITGYNRMIDMSGYEYNSYAATSYSAWGTGFSRKNFQFLLKDVINKEYALSIVKSWEKAYTIYKFSPGLLRGLLSIVKTGHITGDTLVVSYMILNQKYCIWPKISKVRNHGFDGGGEHFGSNLKHPLLTQAIDTKSSFDPDEIEIKNNELIRVRTRQYARQSFINRLIFGIYIPTRYLIYRFTGIIIYK